jgi:glycosyltransferase involved in cell wall biosynthesis
VISVVIPTFGDFEVWDLLARRAQASVEAQTRVCELVRHHADTLQEARNGGAARAGGDLLCFLDADDELDEGYVAAVERAHDAHGERHLYQPATVGIIGGVQDGEPNIIERRPLLQSNFMVIGTVVEHDLFDTAGGFRDLPVLEDWDLWIRCWLEGAEPVPVPDAVYRIHVRADSRNRPGAQHQAAYREITSRYRGRRRERV